MEIDPWTVDEVREKSGRDIDEFKETGLTAIPFFHIKHPSTCCKTLNTQKQVMKEASSAGL